jgi:hypothetical protein
MTEKAKHIDLPYYVAIEAGYCHIENKAGHCIAEAEILHPNVIKRFKFICLAANNFEELVEACKEAKSQIEFGAKVRGGLGHLAPVHTFLSVILTKIEKEQDNG